MKTEGGPITGHDGCVNMQLLNNGAISSDNVVLPTLLQNVAVLRGTVMNVYGHVVATMTGYLTMDAATKDSRAGGMNTMNRMNAMNERVCGYMNVLREKTSYGVALHGDAVGSNVSGIAECVAMDGLTMTGTFPNISTATSVSSTSGVYLNRSNLQKINSLVSNLSSPIVDVTILKDGEAVPDGWDKITSTLNDVSSDLNNGCSGISSTNSSKSIHIAYRRAKHPSNSSSSLNATEEKDEEKDADKMPIVDISVMWGFEGVSGDWECLRFCSHAPSISANLNDGVKGSTELYLCIKRAHKRNVPRVLMQLSTVQVGGNITTSKVPAEWARVNNSCGSVSMEANLNTCNNNTNNRKLFLCKNIAKPNKPPLPHVLNGTYNLHAGDGTMTLAVVGWTAGNVVEGAFNSTQNNTGGGGIKGIMACVNEQYVTNTPPINMKANDNANDNSNLTDTSTTSSVGSVEKMEGPWRTVGVWTNKYVPNNSHNHSSNISSTSSSITVNYEHRWNGVVFTSDPELGALKGTWTSLKKNSTTMASGEWKLIRDDYVQVSYRKDYSTSYVHGVLEFGNRTRRHDVDGMLDAFFASAVLGGDNKVECAHCHRRTEHVQSRVLTKSPNHLLCTIKRFSYDWRQNKARKSLMDVHFGPTITLPNLDHDSRQLDPTSLGINGVNSNFREHLKHRSYGLFAVLVHSGNTSNSGHYYCYVRGTEHVDELDLKGMCFVYKYIILLK